LEVHSDLKAQVMSWTQQHQRKRSWQWSEQIIILLQLLIWNLSRISKSGWHVSWRTSSLGRMWSWQTA
jgi:hypothetical protein